MPAHPKISLKFLRPMLVLGLAILAWESGHAQSAITTISTTTTTGTPTTVTGTNTITFDNNDTKLTSFTTASATYNVTGLATTAYTRRGTAATSVAANNSSVWYDQGANSTTMQSSYGTSMGSVLLGNDLTRGADNVFANGTGAPDGNIERLDFEFGTSGITATSALAFAVFERGVSGQHDGFSIAVITGIDANGNPTSYGGNVVTTTTAEYGSNVYTPSGSYSLFRYGNDGDNLSTWTADTETGTQGLGGVVVSLTDLGIAPGTIIYGYSLMATDVTTNTANLVDWTNATYYPTNSSDATDAAGGLDPAAVNGVIFTKSAAPEPTTSGAIFVGVMLGATLYRRAKKKPALA